MPGQSRRRLMIVSSSVSLMVVGLTAVAVEPKATLLRGDVVDADTKAPLPCRISIRGDDGTGISPARSRSTARRSSTTSIASPILPSSRCTRPSRPIRSSRLAPRAVHACRRARQGIPRGDQATRDRREPLRMTIRLSRWIDVAGLGWYSGDTHAHRTPGELPNADARRGPECRVPADRLGPRGVRAPAARRGAAFRDPGPDPIKIDATH